MFYFCQFYFCTFDALAFTDELFKSWDALAVNNDSRIMMHDKRGKHGIVKNHCYGLDANCIDYGGFSIANGVFLLRAQMIFCESDQVSESRAMARLEKFCVVASQGSPRSE